MNFNENQPGFGIELELADYDNRIEIPIDLGVYNSKDPTIINSIGIANDPTRKWVNIGGEINVTPSNSIDCLISKIEALYELLPSAKSNFKTNIHVHISTPGLSEDPVRLKKFFEYNFENEAKMMDLVNPYPLPDTAELVEFFKKKARSQKKIFPNSFKQKILSGTTPEEMRLAHAPISKTGKWLPHLSPRTGVNTKALWKHNTIEFRHWFGTDDIEQYRDALTWNYLYVTNAIGEQKPLEELYATKEWNFPTMLPYDAYLQKCWDETNFQNRKRKEVKEILLNIKNTQDERSKSINSVLG